MAERGMSSWLALFPNSMRDVPHYPYVPSTLFPCILLKEPNIVSKEPCIPSKEPYFLWKEPSVVFYDKSPIFETMKRGMNSWIAFFLNEGEQQHTATQCSANHETRHEFVTRLLSEFFTDVPRFCYVPFTLCPCILLKEPYIPSKEPCILLKEPCIPSKEPCIPSKEPCIPSKEPCIPSKEPCILSKEAYILCQELVCSTRSLTEFYPIFYQKNIGYFLSKNTGYIYQSNINSNRPITEFYSDVPHFYTDVHHVRTCLA